MTDLVITKVLTRRQTEAVQYCAEGLSNEEISEAMLISVGTVRNLLDAARLKVEAKSIRHLMAKAAASGIAVVDTDL